MMNTVQYIYSGFSFLTDSENVKIYFLLHNYITIQLHASKY